jgi:UDP-glucose 4-epimerase
LDEQARKEYWQINAVLPVEVAKKARDEGTAQFIFFSSMSVYGEIGNLNPPVIITKDTKPAPKDIYGKSKLFAENELGKLSTEYFRVCILRPPMVYGPGAKGNYNALVKIARLLPIFPDISNQRSMLHVDNLCTFIKELIDLNESGLFYPQDPEYIATSQLVRTLALQQNKRIRLNKMLNPFVYILIRFPGEIGLKARKAFGSLIYEQGMSRLQIE